MLTFRKKRARWLRATTATGLALLFLTGLTTHLFAQTVQLTSERGNTVGKRFEVSVEYPGAIRQRPADSMISITNGQLLPGSAGFYNYYEPVPAHFPTYKGFDIAPDGNYIFSDIRTLVKTTPSGRIIWKKFFDTNKFGGQYFPDYVDITTHPDGRIFALASNNRQIDIFDSLGIYLTSITNPSGGSLGSLSGARRIHYYTPLNQILVTASGSGLLRFDADTYAGVIRRTPAGTTNLFAMATGPNGRLYVTGLNQTTVYVLDSVELLLETSYSANQGNTVTSIAVDDSGYVYISIDNEERFSILDSSLTPMQAIANPIDQVKGIGGAVGRMEKDSLGNILFVEGDIIYLNKPKSRLFVEADQIGSVTVTVDASNLVTLDSSLISSNSLTVNFTGSSIPAPELLLTTNPEDTTYIPDFELVASINQLIYGLDTSDLSIANGVLLSDFRQELEVTNSFGTGSAASDSTGFEDATAIAQSPTTLNYLIGDFNGSTNRIIELDTNFTYLDSYSTGTYKVKSITFDSRGRVYYLGNDGKVYIYDEATRSSIDTISTIPEVKNAEEITLASPQEIVIDDQDQLYIQEGLTGTGSGSIVNKTGIVLFDANYEFAGRIDNSLDPLPGSGMALSPDGTYLFLMNRSRNLVRYNLKTQTVESMRFISGLPSNGHYNLRYEPENNLLAILSNSTQKITLVDAFYFSTENEASVSYAFPGISSNQYFSDFIINHQGVPVLINNTIKKAEQLAAFNSFKADLKGFGGETTMEIGANSFRNVDSVENVGSIARIFFNDTIAPLARLVEPQSNIVTGVFDVRVDFNERVLGFEASDVVLSNGAQVSAFENINDTLFVLSIAPDTTSTQRDIDVIIPDGAAQDVKGNLSLADTANYLYYKDPVQVTITSGTGTFIGQDSISVFVTFQTSGINKTFGDFENDSSDFTLKAKAQNQDLYLVPDSLIALSDTSYQIKYSSPGLAANFDSAVFLVKAGAILSDSFVPNQVSRKTFIFDTTAPVATFQANNGGTTSLSALENSPLEVFIQVEGTPGVDLDSTDLVVSNAQFLNWDLADSGYLATVQPDVEVDSIFLSLPVGSYSDSALNLSQIEAKVGIIVYDSIRVDLIGRAIDDTVTGPFNLFATLNAPLQSIDTNAIQVTNGTLEFIANTTPLISNNLVNKRLRIRPNAPGLVTVNLPEGVFKNQAEGDSSQAIAVSTYFEKLDGLSATEGDFIGSVDTFPLVLNYSAPIEYDSIDIDPGTATLSSVEIGGKRELTNSSLSFLSYSTNVDDLVFSPETNEYFAIMFTDELLRFDSLGNLIDSESLTRIGGSNAIVLANKGADSIYIVDASVSQLQYKIYNANLDLVSTHVFDTSSIGAFGQGVSDAVVTPDGHLIVGTNGRHILVFDPAHNAIYNQSQSISVKGLEFDPTSSTLYMLRTATVWIYDAQNLANPVLIDVIETNGVSYSAMDLDPETGDLHLLRNGDYSVFDKYGTRVIQKPGINFTLGKFVLGKDRGVFTLNVATTAAYDITNPLSDTYNFRVSGTGTDTISFTDPTLIDINGYSYPSPGNLTYTYDTTGAIVSIGASFSAITNDTALSVDFLFDEPVFGFDSSAIYVENGTVVSFSGASTFFDAVIRPTTDGLVRISVKANAVTDEAGNILQAPDTVFTNYDGTKPLVTLSSSSGPFTDTLFTVTASFSETVLNIDLADFSIENGNASNLTDVNGDSIVYSFDVMPVDSGMVNIVLLDSTVQDLAGNYNDSSGVLAVLYDTTQAKSILTAAVSGAVNTSFFVNVQFSKTVTGFTQSDVAVVNATVSNFSGSGSAYLFEVFPIAEGPVAVSIPDSIAIDVNGQPNIGSDLFTLNYDLTGPIASINNLSADTIAGTWNFEILLNEPFSDLDTTDLVVTNGTITAFSPIGTEVGVSIESTVDGVVSINLPIGSFTDTLGNQNPSDLSFSVLNDVSGPIATLSTTFDDSLNTAFDVLIAFNEDPFGVDLADFVLTNAVATSLSGSGTNYTLSVDPVDNGTVDVLLPPGAVTDRLGNENDSSNVLSIEYDTTDLIGSISTTAGQAINGPIVLDISFNKPIPGLSSADFRVSNGSVGTITGSGTNFSALFTPLIEDDFDVQFEPGRIVDVYGNPLSSSPYLFGVYDITGPTIGLSYELNGEPIDSVNTSFVVDVTISEDYAVFDSTVFVVTNGTITSLVNTSSESFDLQIQPTSQGLVTIQVPQGAIADTLGQPGSASNLLSVFYDVLGPVATLNSTVGATTNTAFTVTASFDEQPFGLEISDFSLVNATISNLDSTGLDYSITLEPVTNGLVSVELPAGSVADALGNANLLSNRVETTYDSSALVPAITSTVFGAVNSSFTADITFNKSVADFDVTDLSVVNATLGSFSGSGSTYSVLVTPTSEGLVQLFVLAGVATDSASNQNVASGVLELVYDVTGPFAQLSNLSADTVSGSFDLQITFDEEVSGFNSSLLQVSNGVVTDSSINGLVHIYSLSSSVDGAITAELPANSFTDSLGNPNQPSNQVVVLNDVTGPVPALSTTAPDSLNSSFSLFITFSETPASFTLGDFNVSNANVQNLSGSGTTYTAEVVPVATGTVTVELLVGAVTDRLGNGNPASNQVQVVFDDSPLLVSIDQGYPAITNQPFSLGISATKNIGNLMMADLEVVNATVSGLAGDGLNFTVLVTPNAEGVVQVTIPDSIVTDAFGNSNSGGNTASVFYDITPPQFTLETPNDSVSGQFTVQLNPVDTLNGLDISTAVSIVNGSLLTNNLRSAGITFSVLPDNDGLVTVTVADSAFTDNAGNYNTAQSIVVLNDETGPDVFLTTAAPGKINQAFEAQVSFSEPVDGLEVSDFELVNATATLTATPPTFTLLITPDSIGEVKVWLPAGVVTDRLGNLNLSNSDTIQVDFDSTLLVPTLTSNKVGATNSTFDLTFSFSKNVTGFTASDIATSNAQITAFNGSGASYLATVTPTAEGLVQISLPENVVADENGNPNAASQVFSILYDLAGPQISLNTATDSVAELFVVGISSNEDFTGLEFSDFQIVNGLATNLSLIDSRNAELTVEPENDGTLLVKLAAGALTDTLGNVNADSVELAIYVDQSNPVLTLTSQAPNPINGDFMVTVSSNEAVTGLSVQDISVTNGTAGNLQEVSTGTTFEFTVSPAADGVVSVTIPMGAVVDALGNENEASNLFEIQADLTEPVLTIQSNAVDKVSGTFTLTFSFSEVVTGFEQADLQLMNATVSSFSTLSAGLEFEALIVPIEDGMVLVEVDSGAVTDSAANSLSAGSDFAFSIVNDQTAPLAELSTSDTLVNGSFEVLVVFSEEVDLTANALLIENGSLQQLTALSDSIYTIGIDPVLNGLVSISLDRSMVGDGAGNTLAPSDTIVVRYDNISPSIVLSSQVDTVVAGEFSVELTPSESIIPIGSANLLPSDFAVSNATITNILQLGSSYRLTVLPTAAGTVTLSLPANRVSDLAGNLNSASNVFQTSYDPTLLGVSLNNPTSEYFNSTLELTATFTQAVSGFESSDLVLDNGSVESMTTTDSINFTVTVRGINEGQVRVSIPAGVAVNANGSGNLASSELIAVYDVSSPAVVFSPDQTGQLKTLEFDLTFSERVSGFSRTDLEVRTEGPFGLQITTTDSLTFKATFVFDQEGVAVIVLPAQTVTDRAGNQLTEADSITLSYDLTGPVAALSLVQPASSTSGAFDLAVSFNEKVTNLSQLDFQVTNGAITSITGSMSNYTLTIVPAAEGEVTVQLVPVNVADPSGNAVAASNIVTILNDETGPVPVWDTDTLTVVDSSFSLTLSFNEPVSGLETSSFELDNGLLTAIEANADSTSFTLDFDPVADGFFWILLKNNAVSDSLGNRNIASDTVELRVAGQTDPLIVVLESKSDVVCNGAADGSFILSVSGGVAPYTYVLNEKDTMTENEFSFLAAGTYKVVVTDSLNQQDSITVDILEPDFLQVSSEVVDQQVTLTATGGVAPYSYQVGNGDIQTSPVFTNQPNGTFTYRVIDKNGCTAIVSATINVVTGFPSLADAGISVYPNPVLGEFVRIDARNSAHTPGRVELSTIDGRQIDTTVDSPQPDQKRIRVSDLPNGLYLIKLYNAEGKVIGTQRIIIR